jgi:hypothetical protein
VLAWAVSWYAHDAGHTSVLGEGPPTEGMVMRWMNDELESPRESLESGGAEVQDAGGRVR